MADLDYAVVLLRLAVFVVAAYLFSRMYAFSKRKIPAFSRALGALVIAVVLFVLLEALQTVGLLAQDAYELSHLMVSLAFLIMLTYALEQIMRDMMALDHIVHRRFRKKTPDVD